MLEERIQELATGLFESMPACIRHSEHLRHTLPGMFGDTIRLAIKESSEEKDEVIRKLSGRIERFVVGV